MESSEGDEDVWEELPVEEGEDEEAETAFGTVCSELGKDAGTSVHTGLTEQENELRRLNARLEREKAKVLKLAEQNLQAAVQATEAPVGCCSVSRGRPCKAASSSPIQPLSPPPASSPAAPSFPTELPCSSSSAPPPCSSRSARSPPDA
eukprot:RCo036679